MTAKEMYKYLEKIIEEGKGDYRLTCEGGCCSIDEGKMYDELKEIEFG